MRVTFVLPNADMSGGIRVIAVYADYLRGQGHEVTVVSVMPRRPTTKAQLKALLKGRSIPRQKPQGPSHLNRLGMDWKLLPHSGPINDVDVPDADLVIATWWETAYWVANLAPKKGLKCYFMQDYGAPGQSLEKIVPSWKLGIPIITISRWLKGLIHEHAPDASVRLVSNGVDLEQFYSEYEFTEREHVGIVYSGLPTKRISLAVESVALVRRSHPDLLLRMIGAPKTPMPDFVRPSGRVSDEEVRKIYSRCKAWIFASEIEGYGLPILEAMACGTPVVAAPAGAAPELLESGGGKLLDSGDPKVFAKAVKDIITLDQTSWNSLSQAARREAEKHSWRMVCGRMEAALSEVLTDSQ